MGKQYSKSYWDEKSSHRFSKSHNYAEGVGRPASEASKLVVCVCGGGGALDPHLLHWKKFDQNFLKKAPGLGASLPVS